MQQPTPDQARPFDADDETIRAALAEAHIPSLMTALVHITGDAGILRGDIRPDASFFGDPQGGITEVQQSHVRELAFEALTAWRDGRALGPLPSPELIQEMIDFVTGEAVSGDYVEFLTSELALTGDDPYRAPGIEALPESAKRGFQVIVIGAGMSGILAAIRLKEAGIPYLVVEKNADVGGTWFENTYPGCRVDSPNHTYSYSFEPEDWPQHFSARAVLHGYFERCATEYGIRDHVRFETEVVRARFDEAAGTWKVEVRGADGAVETLTANAVISAVGQLNRPKLPDIPGRERFAGISFHSARWEHEHDLEGKRIGVIGTGASAFQFIPEIARDAADVTVFQRTPPWMSPTPEYHDYVSAGKHWLLRNVPFYAKWFRFWMFWVTAEGLLARVEADPAWNDTSTAISAANEELRVLLTAYLTTLADDDAELLEKIVPRYPVGGKRMLRDNGSYVAALKRDNVHLVTETIREITPAGIVTADGQAHDFDVIVYGTGFYADRFLFPMEVYGRGGALLHERWRDEPRAYLGITVPEFPNLFCLYGPNTNIVVNGSIVFFSECEVRYVLGCIALLLGQGHRAMDPKPDVHAAYNESIDAGNARMAWGIADVNSWYKNARGHVTQNWPFTLLEFWRRTREPDPSDYRFS